MARKLRNKGSQRESSSSSSSNIFPTLNDNTNKKQKSQQLPLLLWMTFLFGLVLCLVNITYLFCVTHFQANPSSSSSSSSTTTTLKSQEANRHAPFGITSELHGNSIDNGNNHDKERILRILLEEGGVSQDELTLEVISKLPTWTAVVDQLGSEPRIYGLDTCATFVTTVAPEDAVIAPAGAFNSGTNLLAELLIHNCYNPKRREVYNSDGVRWQVNWGKHQPPKYRLDQEVYQKGEGADVANENILPVITIRDPYMWLQSLCRNRYATHWFHEVNFHCPNLVPNHVEREFLPQALDGSYKRDRIDLHHKDPWLMDNVMNTANYTLESKTVPVYVKYNRETINHDSLVHMWNDWYHDYFNATSFPRVMVRYEDLLFFGQQVTTAACHCFGGKMKNKFRHIVSSAKVGTIHLNKTSLVDNMIKFAQRTDGDKVKGMTVDDLEFAKETLARDLMDTFAYRHPKMKS